MTTANPSVDPLRVQAEDQFAETLVSDLPNLVQKRWQASASVHRFLTHKNKRLVVFKLEEARPKVFLTLSCVGADLSFREGLRSVWADAEHCKTFYIGHRPKEIVDGCFLWHPSSSGIEARIVDSRLSISVSTLLRQPHNPLKGRSHSGFTVMEYRHFQTQFGG